MGRPARQLRPERSTRDFYGSELRRMREAAGWSLEKLAEETHFSKSHLSRIELAEFMIPPELSPRLDQIFGMGQFFQALYELVLKEAYPDKARRRMELETRAILIEEYSGLLVPGLLQTEDYARTIFWAGHPTATPDRIEELVRSRMSRQERLQSEEPPYLTVILDEAVIRRPIGTTPVWRSQLKQLHDLAHTPTTMVQVLPFSHGVYPLLSGPLTLLTLDDKSQYAYTEALAVSTVIDDWAEICTRRRQYELARAYALSPDASAALIRDAMEALPA